MGPPVWACRVWQMVWDIAAIKVGKLRRVTHPKRSVKLHRSSTTAQHPVSELAEVRPHHSASVTSRDREWEMEQNTSSSAALSSCPLRQHHLPLLPSLPSILWGRELASHRGIKGYRSQSVGLELPEELRCSVFEGNQNNPPGDWREWSCSSWMVSLLEVEMTDGWPVQLTFQEFRWRISWEKNC